MSSIHYFQRYSQKENVITNNTLLLFSRLYNESPLKFKHFLNALTNEFDINVGIDFNQQTKGKGSIPDGAITQESFKIAIETKLSDNFSILQLTNHLNSFGNESTKILLALSPKKINNKTHQTIINNVKEFSLKSEANINFISTTFKEIVLKFRDTINDYDIELNSIIDDFEDFCITVGMIRKNEFRMLTVACGWTLKDNFKNNNYYDPANRGYSYLSHLGIYNDKSVRGIGKIENIITANMEESGNLIILNTTNGEITQKQKNSIIQMIQDAKDNLGWNISQNHKFFCVDKFIPTDFKKMSKNGLLGKKYFNLNSMLGKEKFENTNEIAELLKLHKW